VTHEQDARISQVLHPVDDVAAAVDFYGKAFGFSVAFTDANRDAALDAGPIKLALAGPAEDVTGGEPPHRSRSPTSAPPWMRSLRPEDRSCAPRSKARTSCAP
jgi:catechol 2,3-dioxygenase-like lactoylglutathione lyase family enzyme